MRRTLPKARTDCQARNQSALRGGREKRGNLGPQVRRVVGAPRSFGINQANRWFWMHRSPNTPRAMGGGAVVPAASPPLQPAPELRSALSPLEVQLLHLTPPVYSPWLFLRDGAHHDTVPVSFGDLDHQNIAVPNASSLHRVTSHTSEEGGGFIVDYERIKREGRG